jgi:hypothetical protein
VFSGSRRAANAQIGPAADALLVTRQPNVEPLEVSSPEQVSDEVLESLWRQVAQLHAAGISHGRLNAGNVLVVEDEPMLVDLSAATLGAPQSSLEIDVAELLVACAVLVGSDRALRKAVDAGWADSVARVLPYLQRGRADAAPAGPRAHARSRDQRASRRRCRRIRHGGAGDRAASMHSRKGRSDDGGGGLRGLSAQALAAGAVDDVSETMVQTGLFLLTLPIVGASVDTSQFRGASPDTRLLIGIGVAVAVSAVAVLTVPNLRAKVVPGMRGALSALWIVARDRRKRVELFGGNVVSELLYALALGAACLAYGADLNLAQLVFVNTSASVLSSLIPVPGGIGAAEAALSAGLIAMGVDESTAFAIALTQRLCTFYLAPIWGYASLRWLGRKGYV